MKHTRLIPILLILFSQMYVLGQSTVTLSEFLNTVTAEHPTSKRASLYLEEAEAQQQYARGFFDPYFESSLNQKKFDDKNYYKNLNGSLRLPTSLVGIDVLAGYENNDGVFLNPENTTDPFGLWNVGLEANLIQGLLIDERRAAQKQATIAQELAKNQRDILLNDLLYQAANAYINWQVYEESLELALQNISLATTYFDNTKLSFFNGEKSAIDTLEAFIILQDAENLKLERESQAAYARQQLSYFFWDDQQQPMALSSDAKPQKLSMLNLSILVPTDITNQLVEGHPILSEKINKLQSKEIDLRLKREKLKPKLKAKFNPLLYTDDNLTPHYSSSDFKWGFDFSMPLFFRKEKSQVLQTKIDMESIQLDYDQKRLEIRIALENSLMQLQYLEDQRNILQSNIVRYQQLLDAENEKFLYGESSVFLINKRQEKYFDGRLKLIKTIATIIKEKIKLKYYLNAMQF